MRARGLLIGAVVAIALAAAAWSALDRRELGPPATGVAVVPTLAARLEALDHIELFAAGKTRVVELRKVDGRWLMPDRDNWPANQRQVGEALHRIAIARRVEAKTADPARHVRLGVEDLAAADAKGAELRLSGGGEPLRLLIGDNHPALGGSYLRVDDDPQVWLVDADLAPARDPVVWLDRRLFDMPVARVDHVRIAPAQGRAMTFARADGDRFGLDGQPPEAMANPDDGVATAGFTDQLALDDVARDSGTVATLTGEFSGVDGVSLVVQAWQDERGTWVRLQPTLDEVRARAWFEQAATAPVAAAPATTAEGDAAATMAEAEAAPATAASGAAQAPVSLQAAADAVLAADAAATTDAAATPAAGTDAAAPAPIADVDTRLAALKAQVQQWRQQFDGRQFLLPPYKAQLLWKTREQYLAGSQ